MTKIYSRTMRDEETGLTTITTTCGDYTVTGVLDKDGKEVMGAIANLFSRSLFLLHLVLII
ncbi:hypothetical protein [Fischerella sp. PCC 9605]|uniref:hypothetical protein n=1 Tax=Fischerella sp. PCC 9605 TaxID=1173024 RepID=UPI0012DFA579|nr:hypothetical protein [Fischerella sp. PCC 9605]